MKRPTLPPGGARSVQRVNALPGAPGVQRVNVFREIRTIAVRGWVPRLSGSDLRGAFGGVVRSNNWRRIVQRLIAKDGQACFHSSNTLDESPAVAREVRHAIARAKEGDRDAVRYLYVRYSGNVYGYVRSLVQDDKHAEDITQQVFLKLITVISRYQDRGIPFSGWLMRVARNAALDHLRRQRVVLTPDITEERDHSEDDDASDRARVLRGALETLPEEQRAVVVMRHVVGLTPSEIAERLGRTESSIHGLHHRGRRALQQELRRLQLTPATIAAS